MIILRNGSILGQCSYTYKGQKVMGMLWFIVAPREKNLNCTIYRVIINNIFESTYNGPLFHYKA